MKRVGFTLAGAAVMTLALALSLSAPATGEEGSSGKDVFLAQKCNMCHSVPAEGIEAKMKAAAMKGPDLTKAVAERDPDTLTKFLRKEGEMEGATHKKAFGGSDEELQTLLAWIGTLPE